MGTEKQGDILGFGHCYKWTPDISFAIQFGVVATAELFPPGRIMTKPLAQVVARGQLFQPGLQMELLFFMPRGQRRSTRKREPSLASNESYTRLTRIMGTVLDSIDSSPWRADTYSRPGLQSQRVSTRFLPACLAAYMASSAREMKVSAVSSG